MTDEERKKDLSDIFNCCFDIKSIGYMEMQYEVVTPILKKMQELRNHVFDDIKKISADFFKPENIIINLIIASVRKYNRQWNLYVNMNNLKYCNIDGLNKLLKIFLESVDGENNIKRAARFL